MKGILAASTPRILGGNMEDASKEFKKQIKDYPQNYLSSLNYMQYYLIPMYMEDEFFSMLKIVEGKLIYSENEKIYTFYTCKITDIV